jgi:monovalent cation:H+ antiporter-2, CPA2 family
MHAKFADTLRRVAFHSFSRRSCTHLDAVQDPTPISRECASCVGGGSTWLALRMCLTCGSIGCCDSSAGRHASAHFEATGHPIIRSIEPGEAWAWCYLDKAYLDLPVAPEALDA